MSMFINFDSLLTKVVELKASDLFIAVGKPLCVKIDGKLVPLNQNILSAEKVKSLVLELMTPQHQSEFIAKKEYNFAIQSPKAGRFRVSAFYEKLNMGAVLRRISDQIPTLEQLAMPLVLQDLALLKRGLILLIGATGAGKSSTMAAMVKSRIENSAGHVITIEDPIEFIYQHGQSIVTQREVGLDTESYGVALKNTLRQAPDVIVIGEIRSSDTMEYALQFAETGHLCLATLHANNANQALERIISFFPAMKHPQVWLELSLNLKAIIGQQLLPRIDGKGRIPAVEVLINTPIIQSCIKKGAVDSLKEYMARDNVEGMQTFDQSLFQLYKNKQISFEDAIKHADSESEVRLKARLDNGDNLDTGSLSGVGLQE